MKTEPNGANALRCGTLLASALLGIVVTGTSVVIGGETGRDRDAERLSNSVREGDEQTLTAALRFAGGAVRFRYDPRRWTVAEMPEGRQILLVLTRDRHFPQRRRYLTDGVWIAYHHLPQADRDDAALQERLVERFRWATDGRAVPRGEIELLELDGQRAGMQPFTLAVDGPRAASTSREGALTPPEADDTASQRADSAPRVHAGFHVVATMPQGWLDFHFVSDEAADEGRQASIDLLRRLELGSPEFENLVAAEHLAEAEPILGRWKCVGGLLGLSPQGEIVLRFDRHHPFSLDQSALLDYNEPTPVLIGAFSAHRDLLQIRWQDGSRLNIRWRLEDGELFLTDHHGRVNQLSRVFP